MNLFQSYLLLELVLRQFQFLGAMSQHASGTKEQVHIRLDTKGTEIFVENMLLQRSLYLKT